MPSPAPLHPLTFSLFRIADPFVPTAAGLGPVPHWTTGYGSQKTSLLARFRAERWSKAKRPFAARWRQSTRVMVYPGEEISRCIYLEGIYEPHQMLYLDGVLKRGMVFADIGANCGLYSLVAASRVGPRGAVIAVEPSGREFGRLEQNLALNGAKNVRAYRLALGQKEDTADLRIASLPHTGHNTLSKNFAYADTRLETVERIRMTTLDRLLEAEKIDRLDVLKLDTEGSELGILKGSERTLRAHHPVILIEILPPNLDAEAEELWGFIRSLGYRLMAYAPESGVPFAADRHPGAPHTDFIAVPGA